MNAVWLVIWLNVNGTPAMMQAPIEPGQSCVTVGQSLKLPAGSSWSCVSTDKAAAILYRDGCDTHVGRKNGMDFFICRK